MKKRFQILGFICLISIKLIAQKTFQANVEKSTLNWTGYASLGSYAPTGTVKLRTGSITFNKGGFVKGSFVIDMKSINQSNKDLETHLKNEDFFDVEKFPFATFIVEQLTEKKVIGKLKIKDTQRNIAFPIVSIKVGDNQIIEGTITIDRTEFGIQYNSTSFFSNLGDYAIKDNFDFKVHLFFERIK